MKRFWILLVLPAAAYCGQGKSDFFSFSERENECLQHMEMDLEAEEIFEEGQGLSLLEIDESDESLILWTEEDLASEQLGSGDFTEALEREGVEIHEEFEDVFAYETPCYGEGVVCKPTYEKISEERKRLFHRPRVVESSPQEEEKKRPLAKKIRKSPPHR